MGNNLPHPLTIYRQREVCERLQINRVTLWEWRRKGYFPAPIRLGPNTIGWPAAVVDEWIASRPSVGSVQS